MSTERGRNPMSEDDYPDLIATACEDLSFEVYSQLPMSFFTVPPGGLEETYGQAEDRLRRMIGSIEATEVAQHATRDHPQAVGAFNPNAP